MKSNNTFSTVFTISSPRDKLKFINNEIEEFLDDNIKDIKTFNKFIKEGKNIFLQLKSFEKIKFDQNAAGLIGASKQFSIDTICNEFSNLLEVSKKYKIDTHPKVDNFTQTFLKITLEKSTQTVGDIDALNQMSESYLAKNIIGENSEFND